MSGADDDAGPGLLARTDGAPTFDEPWQAQVMALAFNLIDTGVVDNSAWSAALGAELERARARGAADTTASYYGAALAALESLLDNEGRVDAAAVAGRTEAWRAAYLRTPHGQPVTLGES